jgi:hypothetical protein
MEAASLNQHAARIRWGTSPLRCWFWESKALDLPGLLGTPPGFSRVTALSTKQEDKAVDNERFLNQIKSFDHWLFCVQCRSTPRLSKNQHADATAAVRRVIDMRQRASSRKQPESCTRRRATWTPTEHPK